MHLQSSTGSTITHHPYFYYPTGSHIFRLEDTLYKLFHDRLEQDSEIFHMLFNTGDEAPTTEGTINEDPIFLPDLTVEVFDMYLELSGGW